MDERQEEDSDGDDNPHLAFCSTIQYVKTEPKKDKDKNKDKEMDDYLSVRLRNQGSTRMIKAYELKDNAFVLNQMAQHESGMRMTFTDSLRRIRQTKEQWTDDQLWVVYYRLMERVDDIMIQDRNQDIRLFESILGKRNHLQLVHDMADQSLQIARELMHCHQAMTFLLNQWWLLQQLSHPLPFSFDQETTQDEASYWYQTIPDWEGYIIFVKEWFLLVGPTDETKETDETVKATWKLLWESDKHPISTYWMCPLKYPQLRECCIQRRQEMNKDKETKDK